MCLKTDKHEPYLDALLCFENGHTVIRAYREKYGFSYREAIRKALTKMDLAQKTEESKNETGN